MDENLQMVDSGSLSPQITDSSPEEKNISHIKNELQDLKELVRKLQIQQLSKDLQLPVDVIENSNEIPVIRRTKRGKGSIPILESEIREAQSKTQTAADAARYLKIHYFTYKKYAKLYGVWKTNVHYKREGIILNPEKGRYPLSKLIAGEFPNYPVYRLKDKLIQGEIKKPECEQCGYKERRITDNKIPLILNFEDGNHKNHKLDNIKLLCYNCTFCSGKGYIRRGRKYHEFDDPDRVQGANEFVPERF